MIDSNQSVAALVLEHPATAEVLQQHRIDFCCRGQESLRDVAGQRQLPLEPLVEQLERAIQARQGVPGLDARTLDTPALIAHIVDTHHAMLRRALPFVQTLSVKVARVHGDHNPKLRPLERAVQDLVDALLPHLDDEEASLFPGLIANPTSPGVQQELQVMAEEHLEVAAIIERIHEASEEFSLPEWACNSYRTLFNELQAVETDLFRHVHLENHVLRPRALEAAGALPKA